MAGRAAGITSSWVVLLAVTLMAARSASAEAPSQIDIVKATQNPLTRDLGSLAFENTFSFGLGPDDEFGYALIIKPRCSEKSSSPSTISSPPWWARRAD